MIVGDDELDAVEAAATQSEKEVLPRRAAFPVGHVDSQNLAASVPVDSDGDQHGLAHDHAAIAHLLIARVEDEVRKGLGEGAVGKGVEALVQALVDGGDGGGREGMAAQLLGDRLHLSGRDALHVHLGQRRDQRLLGALIYFARTEILKFVRPPVAVPIWAGPRSPLLTPNVGAVALLAVTSSLFKQRDGSALNARLTGCF